MELNKKALKILLEYDLLNPDRTAKEDFEFAKDAGYMFDSITQTHDETIEIALQELNKC